MQSIKKVFSNDSDKQTQTTSPTSASGIDSTGNSRSSVGTAGTQATSATGAVDASSHGGRAVESAERGINSHGHSHTHHDANEFDPKTATHSHSHLKEKVQETRHHHETEEVERLRDHERHVHHVQHHVQPVKDEHHHDEQHHQRAIPQTHVEERHVSTDSDHKAFQGLHTHKDTVSHAPKERTVVDLGERVNETTHHHVHNVIQPVVHKDTHEHHKIHTVIPTHHVEHHAPIVHQSVEHGILHKDEFLKQGGKLGSNITHENADVLATGDCERKVDGVGEKLAKELNLGGHSSSGAAATTGTTTGSRV